MSLNSEGVIEKARRQRTDLPFALKSRLFREAFRREKPDRPLDTNVEFFHCHPPASTRAGDSAAGLYGDLRGGPRRGMDGRTPGAAERGDG